jgi:Ankyrin repeats (3 copies)
MDTGFTRLPRPLAHIESFLHETTSIEAPVPDRSTPRDVLLSTLATLPLIDTPTIDAITKAIDDELGEEEFRILLRRADAGDPAIVNRLDAQGFTALTLATLRGDYARVDLLLTCCRRIDVDQPNKRGDTPLMIAASGGDYVITGRLIDAGADPARENHQGLSSADDLQELEQ